MHTNLVFENIPTMPLELCVGIELKTIKNFINIHEQIPTDSVSFTYIVEKKRKHLNLLDSRQIRQKNDIIEGTNQASVSINKISRFSIRPP